MNQGSLAARQLQRREAAGEKDAPGKTLVGPTEPPEPKVGDQEATITKGRNLQMTRTRNLNHAWKQVRRNQGAASV